MKKSNQLIDYEYNSWLFAGVLLICFAFSAGMRYQQFETWKNAPNIYFVGERPLMTTLDAPFWLRLAREYNEVKFGGEALQIDKRSKDEKSKNTESINAKFIDYYPSLSSSSETNYRNVPLLSFLIAKITPFFNNNYYLTGTLLVPILASLFIIPLGIYFFVIGMPVLGMLGGLIGTFYGARLLLPL